MKGVIVVNGYYTSDSYTHQVARLMEEFSFSDTKVDVYINNAPVLLGTKFNIDFAVFLDKDIILARIMEQDGVRVFNTSYAIENTDNKIKTALILANYDVKMPKTISAPVQYKYSFDSEYLKNAGKELGYPVVVKTAQGSLGTGVFIAYNEFELYNIDKNLGNCEKLYQQFIEESKGKSYRVIVIGNKVKATMILSNDKDFRSNVNLGGIAKIAHLNKRYQELAEKVSKYLDLDYCGIDFFVGNEMILEVNSNAFYKKAEEITKVNIAKEYTDYILGIMGEKDDV